MDTQKDTPQDSDVNAPDSLDKNDPKPTDTVADKGGTKSGDGDRSSGAHAG